MSFWCARAVLCFFACRTEPATQRARTCTLFAVVVFSCIPAQIDKMRWVRSSPHHHTTRSSTGQPPSLLKHTQVPLCRAPHRDKLATGNAAGAIHHLAICRVRSTGTDIADSTNILASHAGSTNAHRQHQPGSHSQPPTELQPCKRATGSPPRRRTTKHTGLQHRQQPVHAPVHPPQATCQGCALSTRLGDWPTQKPGTPNHP